MIKISITDHPKESDWTAAFDPFRTKTSLHLTDMKNVMLVGTSFRDYHTRPNFEDSILVWDNHRNFTAATKIKHKLAIFVFFFNLTTGSYLSPFHIAN
jgi:hypothetical protein